MEQLKLCVETAASSMRHALTCNVYCTSVEVFARVKPSTTAAVADKTLKEAVLFSMIFVKRLLKVF